jgi:hypothetical protein
MLTAISQLSSVIERQHHHSGSDSVLARCRRIGAIFTVLDFVRGHADCTQMKWILAGSLSGIRCLLGYERIRSYRHVSSFHSGNSD